VHFSSVEGLSSRWSLYSRKSQGFMRAPRPVITAIHPCSLMRLLACNFPPHKLHSSDAISMVISPEHRFAPDCKANLVIMQTSHRDNSSRAPCPLHVYSLVSRADMTSHAHIPRGRKSAHTLENTAAFQNFLKCSLNILLWGLIKCWQCAQNELQ